MRAPGINSARGLAKGRVRSSGYGWSARNWEGGRRRVTKWRWRRRERCRERQMVKAQILAEMTE
jgi:hypothetical protein